MAARSSGSGAWRRPGAVPGRGPCLACGFAVQCWRSDRGCISPTVRGYGVTQRNVTGDIGRCVDVSESLLEQESWRYYLAQDALADAFEAARKVHYAPGSLEMARLARAQAHFAATRHLIRTREDQPTNR